MRNGGRERLRRDLRAEARHLVLLEHRALDSVEVRGWDPKSKAKIVGTSGSDPGYLSTAPLAANGRTKARGFGTASRVTVTFWGAPASGTGVLGMYGMTRPDKFHIEKRATGSRSCGSMTFRAPGAPGQYDFRLFHDDVNRPLLAQSNVVTVS